ncbi:hypothetical protein SCLCIDRAFT_1169759 [Scleroderma citrinum Foug A]|uniref:Uncharacterized protein n=1 Tax=Scleroderma citrinum Foug A TaxID=1036808 RepID=A0A0C3DTP2_9AGAM|nr:hypothetical protein SCLCIDRAFT_1169759 [Scleroderma citrinum Foug A]
MVASMSSTLAYPFHFTHGAPGGFTQVCPSDHDVQSFVLNDYHGRVVASRSISQRNFGYRGRCTGIIASLLSQIRVSTWRCRLTMQAYSSRGSRPSPQLTLGL